MRAIVLRGFLAGLTVTIVDFASWEELALCESEHNRFWAAIADLRLL
jgi:hypothetical protein